MTALIVLTVSLAAFLFGFLLGAAAVPAPKPRPRAKTDGGNAELKRLKKEYSNFLSYDGTEQL